MFAIAQNPNATWRPASGTAGTADGWAFNSAGTITHPAITTTNVQTQYRRAQCVSATTANSVAGLITAMAVCWRGNAVQMGGFSFVARFSLAANPTGTRAFVGLCALNTNICAADPSAAANTLGMGFDAGDAAGGNWYLIRKDAATLQKIALDGTVPGATSAAPRNATDVYEIALYAKANAGSVQVQITNVTTGATHYSGTVSTSLPVSTALLYVHAQAARGGASGTAAQFDLMSMDLNPPIDDAFLVVADIAALRQIPADLLIANHTATVRSYSAAGGKPDGGGGVFCWVVPAVMPVDDGGTIIVPTSNSMPPGYWQRQYAGALDVKWFGAKGDNVADDYPAIQAAVGVATAIPGGTVRFPAGTYLLNMIASPLVTSLTATCPLEFAYGAVVNSSAGKTLVLERGYSAEPYQVFGAGLVVNIRFWTKDVIYFEHFGAKVMTDPRGTTDDGVTTAAIQKLFKSLSGAYYPPPATINTPGGYIATTIHLLGMYGISDEIKVNPGGYSITGAGVGLSGAGFKWVGPDVVGNATKAMLRMYGPQWALIDGLIFLGLPTATDANRLHAGIAFQSVGTVPAPFYSELGRRTTVRRCVFSDIVGYFTQPGGYQFQHCIITEGDNGNDDFHVFDTCSMASAEYGITIGNQQNVDIQIRNCSSGVVKTAALWQRNGGELFIDGFYVYSLGLGAAWFKVGEQGSAQGVPNSRITMRMVGGEGNAQADCFLYNDWGPAASFVFDCTRCEFGLPSNDTYFIKDRATSGPQGTSNYVITFVNCDMNGKFSLQNPSPGHRSALTFIGCRDLANVKVEVLARYSVLDVEAVNCWAQGFTAGPPDLQPVGHERYLNGMNYRATFTALNAATAVSLGAGSLYATTHTLCDKLGLGNAAFGLESLHVYKTFYVTSIAQFTMTFAAMFPANSIVFGCQVANAEGNYLKGGTSDINTAYARAYVGDATQYDRYGTLVGPNGCTFAAMPNGFAPVLTVPARDVILRGAWDAGPSVTWTWSGTTITMSSPLFVAAMVGCVIRFTSGALAGTEVAISTFVSTTTVTVAASNSGSGTAFMWIPFEPGKHFLVIPAYYQMASNSAILTPLVDNLQYAEPLTPT